MRRRKFLVTSAASLALPSIARAQGKRVLKFIPQSDLAILDPMWTTAYTTRNHGYMVFDTLFGQCGEQNGFKTTPQMVAGHVIEDDGKTWKLILREGLLFHDGQKVLASDCVASIRRWGVRNSFGQALMQRTHEITARDDKTVVFHLKQPFALLPDALGHGAPTMCAIMPEQIAATDPFKQVTEMVGSGPFQFKADERMPGSRFVYERFDGYRARESGASDFTAGPKIVHFDRVEWHVIPDPATAAAALRTGEMDWWEFPTADLLPMLRQNRIATPTINPAGQMMVLRPNHLHPPFNSPAVRRALLGAIDQGQYMMAMMGTDTSLWEVPVGFFPPISPLASDAGMSALTSPRDDAAVKQALAAAGYKGEPVVLMVATDFPILKALGDVAADMLIRVGMNVTYQATDWGTVVQRRTSTKPPSEGGWNMFCTGAASLDYFSPAAHPQLRGNGKDATFGWPTNPKIEALRDDWFDAPDLTAQHKIGVAIQTEAFDSVPYYPLGLSRLPTAIRPDITGVLEGFSLFWSVRRA